jgi:Dolichyl-phosphate-mannose-protein mannosyltransferase
MTTDGSASTPPAATSDLEHDSTTACRVSTIEVVAIAGLLALGAYSRAHGFTSLDLWFDDAWAAMPARVGLSQAVHMVLTSPGYGLAMRSWIRLDATTTWWAQLPAFILGLGAIPAVYALVRWLRNPRWLAFAAALIVTVSPLAIQYATRVKEYPFDLLAACAILALAERARRTPSTRRLATLAIASVAGFFVSAGCAPIIAGAWLALSIAVVSDRRAHRPLIGGLFATLAGVVVVWAVFLRTLPEVLTTNWRRRGFLVDYRSLPRAERSVSLIFGGFLHAVLGYPVPVSFYRGTPGVHDAGALAVGVVVLAVAILVPIVASTRRGVTAELASSLALAVALALSVADRVPLGDGRTDEVLYPALLVCLAAAVRSVTPRVRQAVGKGAPARAASGALAAALLVGATVFGVDHAAVYPTISLRGVQAELTKLVRPGDVVFVDTFNSFGWCYYELSPCRVQVGGTPVWPQGFRPVSTSPATTFMASHYGIPLPEFTAAQASARRIWYVGYTYGTFDVGSNPRLYNLPVTPTYFTGLLKVDGWHRSYGFGTQVLGVHAFAVLYVHGDR